MKRRKKQRTQKQRSLRLGIWVAVLTLFVVSSGIYTPFPQMLIRQGEVSLSCGETELARKETLDRRPYFLTSNQHTVLLTVGEYSAILGWQGYAARSLDLSQTDGPLAVAVLRTSPRKIKDPKDDVLTTHYFGVAPREAPSVLIHFLLVEDAQPLELPTFRGEDGRTYFWGWQDVPSYGRGGYNSDFYSEPLLVEALDRDGNVIATCTYSYYYPGLVP